MQPECELTTLLGVSESAGDLKTHTEHVCLLDDPELHSALNSTLRTAKRAQFQMNSATGAGFARGVSVTTPGNIYHLLCLTEHTSQPFSYLTLGAFATHHSISSVIAITGAHSLREDLFPGDLAIVRRASALPYPALYENRDPYGAAPQAEHYDAKLEVVEKYSRLIASSASQHLWQREIPQVTSSYAKHPTWRGELMPWAPEQFEKLKSQGAETLSSTAAGVYEAQALMPDAEIICFNQVRSTPNVDSAVQWDRYKTRFHAQAVTLVQSLINFE